jgi:group I intron endonuclease
VILLALASTAAPKTPGIYLLFNTASGKCYPGQAKDLQKRIVHHCTMLRATKHSNRYLQAAWNKYGADSFVFWVLEHVEPSDDLRQRLVEREQYWFDQFPAEIKFNLAPAAGSTLGIKRAPFSEEWRARLGASHRGLVKSPETCARLSAALSGKRKTPESIAKMKATKTGAKLSEEHKAKIGAASRGRKRAPRTAEVRAKISAALTGKSPGPRSAEHRAKIRAAKLGKKRPPFSAEWRANIGAASKGRKLGSKNKKKRESP